MPVATEAAAYFCAHALLALLFGGIKVVFNLLGDSDPPKQHKEFVVLYLRISLQPKWLEI